MIERVLCPVVVGRDRELDALEDALLHARRREGGVILLAAEAGMGKTRLATELRRRANKIGMEAIWGACSESELALPYLPFVEAISNRLATDDISAWRARLGPLASDLARLFPQIAGSSGSKKSGDPAQGKLRLFEALLTLLSQLADNGGLLVVVEDVHWADASTRELLEYLSRRVRDSRILVLATYRADEVHRRHPLQPLLQAWRRSGTAETIELEPLGAEGVAEIVTAIFDDPTRDDTRDFLYARCDGNPFVLEELLKTALDRGDIYRTEHGWTRRSLTEIKLPGRVRDTILLRLERLEPAHLEVLQAAAVLGSTFSYPVLIEISERAETEVQAGLATAVREQLLDEDGPEQFRFRHALTREAIYDDIISPRRRRLHSLAANAINRARPDDAVALAQHLVAAGDWTAAVPACVAAAEDAMRRWAPADAAPLLERAIEHVDDPAEHARLLGRLGEIYMAAGLPRKALGRLEQAVPMLEKTAQRREAALRRLTLGRAVWIGAAGNRKEVARRHYESAVAALESDGPSPELAVGYLRLAGMHVYEFDSDGAIPLARKAIEVATRCGARAERAWARMYLGSALFKDGSLEEGQAASKGAFEDAVAEGADDIAIITLSNSVWDRTYRVGPAGCLELAARLRQFAPRQVSELHAVLRESQVNYYLGDPVGSESKARRCIDLAELAGDTYTLLWASQVLAAALVELDRLEEAKPFVGRPTPEWPLQDLAAFGGRAWIRWHLASGRPEEALVAAEQIYQHRVRVAAYSNEPLDLAASAFVAAGRSRALKELAAAIRHSDAYALRLRSRVALSEARFASAVHLARDAESAFHAAEYGLEELHAGLVLAQAIEESGANPESELNRVRAAAISRGAELVVKEATARLGVTETSGRASSVNATVGERLVSVLFADVRDYAALTRGAAPASVAERIGALQRWATAEVNRHHGAVDKFAGDAVMATFNAGGDEVDHCRQALEAALGIRDKAEAAGLPVGLAIATGPAIVGALAKGANLSVLGEATNVASRLQAQAQAGEILLSEPAFMRVRDWLRERQLDAQADQLQLKGFDAPVPAFRLRR